MGLLNDIYEKDPSSKKLYCDKDKICVFDKLKQLSCKNLLCLLEFKLSDIEEALNKIEDIETLKHVIRQEVASVQRIESVLNLRHNGKYFNGYYEPFLMNEKIGSKAKNENKQ